MSLSCVTTDSINCILADKFCAHFLSFFLSLEIFYSSMPLLQRCIADSVCASVTIFFLAYL